MSARPAWGKYSPEDATAKNLHVERFASASEQKPIKIWIVGTLEVMLVHYEFGARSIPCLQGDNGEECPYCQTVKPVRPGSETLKPWKNQWEGYAPVFISNKTSGKWMPAVGIFTAGFVKKISENSATYSMFPNLRGCILNVFRTPQGKTKILDFDFETKLEPMVAPWPVQPLMERFWDPLANVEMPVLPEPVPFDKARWNPVPIKITEEQRERAKELAAAMDAAARSGRKFNEAEYWASKKAKEEQGLKDAELVKKQAKRNQSEGKTFDAPRDDMNQPHPADDHPWGWVMPAPLPSEQELREKRTGEIVSDELAARLPEDHPARRGKGGAK